MESFPITTCGQKNLLYSDFLWVAAAAIRRFGFTRIPLHPRSTPAEIGDLGNLRKLEIFQNLFTPGKTFPAASTLMDGISRIVTKRQFFAKQIVKKKAKYVTNMLQQQDGRGKR